MTPRMVIAISGAGALTTSGVGVYELWPPPTDVLVGMFLFLVAIIFPPMGLFVASITDVIVEIAHSNLPPSQKRDELAKCIDPLFKVSEKFTDLVKTFSGISRKNEEPHQGSDNAGGYDG